MQEHYLYLVFALVEQNLMRKLVLYMIIFIYLSTVDYSSLSSSKCFWRQLVTKQKHFAAFHIRGLNFYDLSIYLESLVFVFQSQLNAGTWEFGDMHAKRKRLHTEIKSNDGLPLSWTVGHINLASSFSISWFLLNIPEESHKPFGKQSYHISIFGHL